MHVAFVSPSDAAFASVVRCIYHSLQTLSYYPLPRPVAVVVVGSSHTCTTHQRRPRPRRTAGSWTDEQHV